MINVPLFHCMMGAGNLKDIWAPPLGRIPCSLGGPRFHCPSFRRPTGCFQQPLPLGRLGSAGLEPLPQVFPSSICVCLGQACAGCLSQPLLGCIFLPVPEVMMRRAADQTGVTCPRDTVAREDTQVRKLRSPICSLCLGYRVYFEGKVGHGCLSRARSPL